jgi:porin
MTTADEIQTRRTVTHRASRAIRIAAHLVFITALLAGGTAAQAGDDGGASPQHQSEAKPAGHAKAKAAKAAKVSLKSGPHRESPPELKAPARSAASAVPYYASLADINARYYYRGYDTAFPSMADTILLDTGGMRSALANAGFAFLGFENISAQGNVLDAPRSVPSTFRPCKPADYRLGSICAGNRLYFGQTPDFYNSVVLFGMYDTSRWGVENGVFTVSGAFDSSSYLPYAPNDFRLTLISWYQTAFGGKLEIEAGYLRMAKEFMGTVVGGGYTSVFGPSASLAGVLGLSGPSTASAPAARFTWHITDKFYDEFGVQRSLPVHGQYNPTNTEILDNPTGFNFTSSIPGTREVYMNELGYRQSAAPGTNQMWLRAGGMYNNSGYRDLSQTNPNATTDAYGLYALGDWQLWQQDPSSPASAYRGIYFGGTYTRTPTKITTFYQYFEGRLYWLGPTAARSSDMIALIYGHNDVSKYVSNPVNATAFLTDISAANATNTISLSYIAKLYSGVYLTTGLTYVDRPSVSYFPQEGHAFLLQTNLLMLF